LPSCYANLEGAASRPEARSVEQPGTQAVAILRAGRAPVKVRSHPGDRGLGVDTRELQLDVVVELLETLLAADLRSGRADDARRQAIVMGRGRAAQVSRGSSGPRSASSGARIRAASSGAQPRSTRPSRSCRSYLPSRARSCASCLRKPVSRKRATRQATTPCRVGPGSTFGLSLGMWICVVDGRFLTPPPRSR
jgi:hypothetical protein